MFEGIFGNKAEKPEKEREDVITPEEIVLETEAGDDIDKLPDDTEEEKEETEELNDQLDDVGSNPNVANPVSMDKNIYTGDVEAANDAADNLSLEEDEEDKAA